MKTFLNLTNGLLYDGPFDGFIRIQSCACEGKHWDRVIEDIDHNFLMLLALGYPIQIVDYSARKQVPRSLYQGLEWIWFVCQMSWKLPIDKVEVRGVNCYNYFLDCWMDLEKKHRKKLRYYRKFLNNPKKPIIISGQTDKDGDYEYLSSLANKLAFKD